VHEFLLILLRVSDLTWLQWKLVVVDLLVHLLDQVEDCFHFLSLFTLVNFLLLFVDDLDAALEVADLLLVANLARLVLLLRGEETKPGLLEATGLSSLYWDGKEWHIRE
jgi:hypothetical protein